jgi:hypothetical protein
LLKSSVCPNKAEGRIFDSAAPEESWKQIAAFLGMPVEFDAPEEQRRPWATWLLSAAIICASLLAFPTSARGRSTIRIDSS